jgi:hypothetical protein
MQRMILKQDQLNKPRFEVSANGRLVRDFHFNQIWIKDEEFSDDTHFVFIKYIPKMH